MRLSKKDIIRLLRSESDRYAPLAIKNFKEEVSLPYGCRVDAGIEFSIQNGPSFEAVADIATVSTPQNILRGARLLAVCVATAKEQERVPLIVAPYIGAKQAEILADRGISWIDLCGNMSIRVSNRVYIERTGKPNRFPDTAPIKKIFQGTSSLVSRSLLLKPEGFESLEKMVDFVNQRNANITLSTVSKVLKKLEDELLINKSKSLITVADPEKLLEKLAEGYKNSTERKRRNTYRFSIDNFDCPSPGLFDMYPDYVACGFYAAQIRGLAVTDQITIVVKDMEQFKRTVWKEKGVNIIPDAEYGNLSITETSDPGIWFNTEVTASYAAVDDIELYLEMMVDTPRGQKIAEQLKLRILEKADSGGQKDN